MSIDAREIARTDRKAFCEIRRANQKHARFFPVQLTRIPAEEFPPITRSLNPSEVWRSRHFLVQIFREPGSPDRLTVSRTTLDSDGNWLDGITWDELEAVKNAVGYRDQWAAEIFPPACEVVNVANMRHLWIVPQPAFGWVRKEQP